MSTVHVQDSARRLHPELVGKVFAALPQEALPESFSIGTMDGLGDGILIYRNSSTDWIHISELSGDDHAYFIQWNRAGGHGHTHVKADSFAGEVTEFLGVSA